MEEPAFLPLPLMKKPVETVELVVARCYKELRKAIFGKANGIDSNNR